MRSKKQFEDKPCLGIGRGLSLFIRLNILRDPAEIKFFRSMAAFELELPWFTVIIVDNF